MIAFTHMPDLGQITFPVAGFAPYGSAGHMRFAKDVNPNAS